MGRALGPRERGGDMLEWERGAPSPHPPSNHPPVRIRFAGAGPDRRPRLDGPPARGAGGPRAQGPPQIPNLLTPPPTPLGRNSHGSHSHFLLNNPKPSLFFLAPKPRHLSNDHSRLARFYFLTLTVGFNITSSKSKHQYSHDVSFNRLRVMHLHFPVFFCSRIFPPNRILVPHNFHKFSPLRRSQHFLCRRP